MKKKILTLILTSLLAIGVLSGCSSSSTSSTTSSNDSNTIKVGTSTDYRPFAFINQGESQDKVKGLEIDVWNEIAKRNNWKVQYVIANWNGLIGMLDSGKVDTIAHQVTITPERKQKYYFSDPYVYSGVQLAVKKGNNSIKSLKDLNGKTVAVESGMNFYKAIEKYNSQGGSVKIKQYSDYNSIFSEVNLGRADALVEDKLAIMDTIKRSNYNLQLAEQPIEKMQNAFPMLKNDQNKQKIEKINKTLKAMKQDGTLKKISEKWFGSDITTDK
ncbi:ABC-type amino acid transport substrate-binding protein [Clostridium algifaecis]|uniref:ABC-type amino acid transport substrate-binding protein n=1 Tax=Clostridium algifaecis TaxID=1472040 RepID=A0ABS4KRK9_9CLOT|nr:transporter substrate-binding domain-containing protein [Clostridium algifaecis]MBP2032672.1 ABC-type amino acid transport substrate-binding protein [Clostridium algifaecis]